jgi:hypothetical protein
MHCCSECRDAERVDAECRGARIQARLLVIQIVNDAMLERMTQTNFLFRPVSLKIKIIVALFQISLLFPFKIGSNFVDAENR